MNGLFFFASVLELLLRQNKTRTIKINMKHSILLNALKMAGAKNGRQFILEQLSNHFITASYDCVCAVRCKQFDYSSTSLAAILYVLTLSLSLFRCRLHFFSVTFKWLRMTKHVAHWILFHSFLSIFSPDWIDCVCVCCARETCGVCVRGAFSILVSSICT